jgi:hypothetical protein
MAASCIPKALTFRIVGSLSHKLSAMELSLSGIARALMGTEYRNVDPTSLSSD